MYMFQHSSVSLFGLALVKIKAQVQEEGADFSMLCRADGNHA